MLQVEQHVHPADSREQQCASEVVHFSVPDLSGKGWHCPLQMARLEVVREETPGTLIEDEDEEDEEMEEANGGHFT